ncbi:FK506-binding protein 5 isoform X3 [Periophthalmus magnuspinnatus]|uniref:FK506-binding protein 5 isoform X3 n=1 Tax=Periophthalmus magnuspinnatus TaxID=409849 RepID=UPI0024363522|nr:FK506-binding protein 5 isoform X3 [Periophthalmus magnuspinnatus]
MGTQGAGRKRSTNKDKTTAEDDALNLIAREAEARLAAKRAARAEAREIRMKELERQQKEIFQVQKKYYGLSPKGDDRQDSKWGDIEQWMEDSERYTRPSRIHTLSDEDERMSVGSRGSVRSDLDIVGAYAGGGDSPYSHKKSKKKKKHKHKDKDRNGCDDDYSVMSSRSSRLSDESRMSRSSRLDLTSSVLADESRASRSSRLDLQPTSFASSDLYSLNGLSSSRPNLYNGYQLGRSLSQVPLQSYRRSSLYEDSLCSSSRRGTAQVPLDFSSYRSSGSRSGSRTSSRASSRAGSARTSPVDTTSSSVASFLRSAVSSGLPRDLDDVTIPDFSDVEDGNYLEKGSRAASALTATTLTSLGGTSSRRGSGETALTLDAETSLREIKDKLAEVEEKYRKAMVSNAQLDNEKNNLMYQVDTLKDSLMELEEQLAESRRQYEDKAKDFEREKQAHGILQFQFNELKETLKQSEELLNEIRQLRIKEEGFHREISDLQETVDWKDKKISALERQKEYTDAIRIERDELREEVVKLKDILKKHGIVLGPDLNINGGVTEAFNSEESSSDPNSQPTQETPISPTEGTNSMLGNSEEETKETSDHPTQQSKLRQNQQTHDNIEKQLVMNETLASKTEISANENQPKPSIEHSNANTVMKETGRVDAATSFDEKCIEIEPVEQKDNEYTESEESQSIGNAEIKPTSQDHLEEQFIEKVDSTTLTKIDPERSERREENALAKEDKNTDPVVVASKTETQQDLETLDVDSEDVSAKPHVTSGGGKKKKRKKKGKKKGATSEDKEQNVKPEKQTKSDVKTGDSGSKIQASNELLTVQKIQENKQINLVNDVKDCSPTAQTVEQAGPICDVDRNAETINLVNEVSTEKDELKETLEESNDNQEILDNRQMNDQQNLVEATKQLQQAGPICDIEKDVEASSSMTEVEPKVTEANTTCLATARAEEVSGGEAAVGTSCNLEDTDSANNKENTHPLDNGEPEMKSEASLEMYDGNGTSAVKIDVTESGENVALTDEIGLTRSDGATVSEKDKIIDEVEKQNGEIQRMESEQATTSIANSQVDNSESSVQDNDLKESFADIGEEKHDSLKDNDSGVEEASIFVAQDEILDNSESPKLQNVDSNQEPTANDDTLIIPGNAAAVETIDKGTTEMHLIEEGNDAEMIVTKADNELKSSQIGPDDASGVVSVHDECNYDSKDAVRVGVVSGELKSPKKDVEVSIDVLVQEDTSDEHLSDVKQQDTGLNEGNHSEKLDEIDTNIDVTVPVDLESVTEELNVSSNEDKKVALASGQDVLVEEDSKDQLMNTELDKQGQNIDPDHTELKAVEIKTEIPCKDVEQPEQGEEDEVKLLVDVGVDVLVEDDNSKNVRNDLDVEDKGSQNALERTQEEEVEPGIKVSLEDDQMTSSESQSVQNDTTVLENLDLQPQNLAQNDSNADAQNSVEDGPKECLPMEQDGEEEEDEGEGMSFDFDDLEMEAAIAQSSEFKTIDEEFEVGVEVLADEANFKDDLIDKQQRNGPKVDNGNEDYNIVDKDKLLAVTNNDDENLDGASFGSQSEISFDEIGATSEQATIVQDAKQNSSENNNKQSAMDDQGSNLVKNTDLPSGKTQEPGVTGERNRSGKNGKRGSKKGKGKNKDECKMT